MDVQTNHRVTLLNAKCDVVNKLYNVCKKAEYGDIDVSCCLKEMYAKVKLINRMDCYCFPSLITTTTTPSIFSGVIVTAVNNYIDGNIMYLKVNGVLVSTQVVTSLDLSKQFNIYTLISNSGLTFEYHQVDENGSTVFDSSVKGYYIIEMPCNTNSLIWELQEGKGTVIDKIYNLTPFSQEGVCAFTYSECYNCIEDTDLPKMYEVIKKLG